MKYILTEANSHVTRNELFVEDSVLVYGSTVLFSSQRFQRSHRLDNHGPLSEYKKGMYRAILELQPPSQVYVRHYYYYYYYCADSVIGSCSC
jgi:hypothetical protein